MALNKSRHSLAIPMNKTVFGFIQCLLIGLVSFLVGCNQLNDYLISPTIIDASEHPPYRTPPGYVQDVPMQAGHLPQSQKGQQGALQVPASNTTSWVQQNNQQAMPMQQQTPSRFQSQGGTQQPVNTYSSSPANHQQTTGANVLNPVQPSPQISDRIYAPNHPYADELGYVKIAVPQSPSSRPAVNTKQNINSVINSSPPVSSVTQTTNIAPVSAKPTISQVSVTGIEPVEPVKQIQYDPPVNQQNVMTTVEAYDPAVTAQQYSQVQPIPTLEDTVVRQNNSQMSQLGTGSMTGQVQALEPAVSSTIGLNNSASNSIKVVPQQQTPSLGVTELQPAVNQVQRVTPASVNSDKQVMVELQQLIKKEPRNLQTQLALRFMYLTHGRQQDALGLMADVPADIQGEAIRIVRAAMMAAKVNDPENKNNPKIANDALEVLDQLRLDVIKKADLIISTMAICKDKSVKGFGQYELLDDSQLSSGKIGSVQIYCELQNFQSKIDKNGKHVSELSAEIILYDENYRVIYQLPKTSIQDKPSHKPRKDFFFSGSLKLPSLHPGRYEFVVNVEDKVAGKTALPARKQFEVK